MRQSLQLTNSVILERQFKMTAKQKKTKKSQSRLWLTSERLETAQKRYPAETCETRKYAWVWTQIFSNGLHKPCSRLNLWNEKITQWKGHKSKEKNVSTETRQNGRAVKGARVKKILSWEFWYTSVYVGSNPIPVRKRLEHDEAEPSADKICHTGTLIEG